MNVPTGQSTYVVWLVALAGFITAGLAAWQNAPDWVPVVLAGLSAFGVYMNNAVRASQANHLVDSRTDATDAIGVQMTDHPVLFEADDEPVGFQA